MSKALGKNLRWQLGTGSPLVYANVGYSREDGISYSYDPESIEPTKDDSSLIPEILDGTGTVEVTGTFTGSVESTAYTDIAALRTALYTGALVYLKCVSQVETATGQFVVTSVEFSGAKEGAQSWNVSVRAAGALSYS